MLKVRGYAGTSASSPLEPYNFERRDPTDADVVIDIAFCGICHSDLHSVKNEWGGATYPMVPGHEIVGKVSKVGSKVTRFKVGDSAGVGCFVDSCRACDPCKRGFQQYCANTCTFTYNAVDKYGLPTQGGYSSQMVVDENYVYRIAPGLPLERVAPLLCAGITTYSPLAKWKVGKGHRVGVVGLGGLGHMAVKLAVSLGAEVTMLSTSKSKEADAQRLGAHHFGLTSDPKTFNTLADHFDFLLDTVSAPHSLTDFLGLLKTNGSMVLVGAPPEPIPVQAFALIMKGRTLAGSLIGGVPETQAMLDYCAKTKTFADVEVIAAKDINRAYERMLKGDVRYRFSIDAKTF